MQILKLKQASEMARIATRVALARHIAAISAPLAPPILSAYVTENAREFDGPVTPV
jgi:hypothetical protein